MSGNGPQRPPQDEKKTSKPVKPAQKPKPRG
ncbi:hypothetical protein GGQ82_002317 [Sphingobium olei]